MYFVNEEHENNYAMLVQLYKAAGDQDYKTACYVLALPEIHNKVNGKFGEYPFDWMYRFETINKEEEDFWTKEKYIVAERVYEQNAEGKEIFSDAYGWLSSGHRQLVHMAANLFNSSNEFNLCEALSIWGDELFRIYQQAVLIRTNRIVD